MLGLVIAATVWALTLWQWRRTPDAVSGQAIFWQLLVLPLVLTAVALLAWGAVKRLRALADRPLDAAPKPAATQGLTAAGDGGAPAHVPSADAPEQPVATVLAEALSLSAGHGATEAWHVLKEAGVRPGLDPELSDADGLPVFSARVADLDLKDWMLAHGELSQVSDTPLPEQVLRTLALLEAPLHQLLDALAAWRPEPGERGWGGSAATHAHEPVSSLPAGAPSHLSGVGRPDGQAAHQARAERAPALQVRLCLPAAWTAGDRARAVDWVRSQCGALLDWAEAHGAPAPEWQTTWPSAQSMPQALAAAADAAETSPEGVWTELASLWPAWSASPRPQLLLLLAADSAVDEACVAQWQARGELFTAHHQRGRVPGEAAVGLLLANRAWEAWCHMPPDALLAGGPPGPSAREDIAACPRMWRPQVLRRERSADAVGRVDASGTQALLHGVAQRLAPHADGDWTLVSDGDHRASRTAEVFEALLAVRPQADPMLSVVRVGDGCGDMGLARSLVSVALASAGLRQGEPTGMALALLVQDALQRVAVPLTPPSAQWPTAAPAATPT